MNVKPYLMLLYDGLKVLCLPQHKRHLAGHYLLRHTIVEVGYLSQLESVAAASTRTRQVYISYTPYSVSLHHSSGHGTGRISRQSQRSSVSRDEFDTPTQTAAVPAT